MRSCTDGKKEIFGLPNTFTDKRSAPVASSELMCSCGACERGSKTAVQRLHASPAIKKQNSIQPVVLDTLLRRVMAAPKALFDRRVPRKCTALRAHRGHLATYKQHHGYGCCASDLLSLTQPRARSHDCQLAVWSILGACQLSTNCARTHAIHWL